MNLKLISLSALAISQLATAGCDLDHSDYSSIKMGAPGPIKLFHVTGSRTCQSKENIGYSCAIQVFDATDCDSGHRRLQQMNCCANFNGKMQTNAYPIAYTPGACSVFK